MTPVSFSVEVRRDCPATIVPFGRPVTLAAGERVRIMQQAGGSITVRTEGGFLLRLDADDADAVGIAPDEGARPAGPTGAGDDHADRPFDLGLVTAALHTVYDPEIPLSIVELGLVYRCEEHRGPAGARRIEIDMTMTAPGCGMGDILREDAIRAVSGVPGVDEVEVTLVWDPPWTIHHMSEAARLELGLL
jgi:probable FeS assembly SUF system protein SufT